MTSTTRFPARLLFLWGHSRSWPISAYPPVRNRRTLPHWFHREERWLERQSQTREELMALAPEAVEGIGGIFRGEVPPNRLPASTAVLDRIGLGANVKHDFEVKGSETLAALILKLDEEERPQQLDG